MSIARGDTPTYRPSKVLWAVYLGLCAVTGGFTAISFHLGLSPWLRGFLALFSLMMAVGIVELAVARVEVGDEALSIRGLTGTRRYPYSEISEVKIERPSLFIRLATGEWREFPDWLGANMSARAQIAKRLSS